MASSLPSNVHVSKHPCLRTKLSQLRSASTTTRDTQTLIHEIGLMLATDALADLHNAPSGTDTTPIGFEYEVETIAPQSITIVPILRSGLAMLEAVQTILPLPASVHHLGLFREKISLQPVEYYNNLPHSGGRTNSAAATLAILVDPVIATGGTAAAAIQTLKEWGVERVIVLCIIGAVPGVTRAAEEWPEGTELWFGGIDDALTPTGMIQPGVGDIGDRLFRTMGK